MILLIVNIDHNRNYKRFNLSKAVRYYAVNHGGEDTPPKRNVAVIAIEPETNGVKHERDEHRQMPFCTPGR